MNYPYEQALLTESLPIVLLKNNVKHVTLHWHNRIEFLYVLHGTVKVHVSNKTYSLSEEDLIFINSNEVHGVESNAFNKVIILQIPVSFVEKYYSDFEMLHFYCVSFQDKQQKKYDMLRQKLRELYNIYSEEDSFYEIKIHSLLLELIFYMMKQFIDHEQQTTRFKKTEEQQRLQRIIAYIDQHYMHPITLQEIADLEGVSASYLSRYFHRHMGQTLIKYINSVRLGNAVNRLLNSDDTLLAIAIDCGFSNVNVFHKLFKEKFKITPSTFRRYELESKKFIVYDHEIQPKSRIKHVILNEVNPDKYTFSQV